MRLVWAMAAAAALGALSGWFISDRQFATRPVDYGPPEWDFSRVDQRPAGDDADLPHAVVEGGNEFNFGTLAFDQTESHAFVIRNAGRQPLSLEIVDTTCKCTVGELEADEIPPGESRQVKLTWTVSGYDPEFRQTATLRTNDPQQSSLELSVFGNVALLARPNPTKLTLTQIVRNEPVRESVSLMAYRDFDLKVTEVKFEDPATAEYFSVTTEPLSAKQIAEDREARGGVLVHVDIRPGLPIGPLRQTMQLITNQPEVGTVSIPIEGNVISDLTFVGGRNLDVNLNLIRLGRVHARSGAETSVKLLAKGTYRDHLVLTVNRLDPPDLFEVEFGSAQPVNQGAQVVYPLTIRVPPGSRQVDRFSNDLQTAAKIVLNTGHPDSPQLTLYVSLVVVGE